MAHFVHRELELGVGVRDAGPLRVLPDQLVGDGIFEERDSLKNSEWRRAVAMSIGSPLTVASGVIGDRGKVETGFP
jgi:hypothetical protein